MICPNCKNRIPDDEETCPFCGADLKGGAQSGEPSQSQNSQPASSGGSSNKADPYAGWGSAAPKETDAKPSKKSKVPLIIGIVAVVAILIGVIVAFVLPHGDGGGNPSANTTGTVPPASDEPIDYKPDVVHAVTQSYETYLSTAKAMMPEEIRTMLQSPGHSADLSLTLEDIAGIPDLTIDPSLLNSLGIRSGTHLPAGGPCGQPAESLRPRHHWRHLLRPGHQQHRAVAGVRPGCRRQVFHPQHPAL